jgi:hypothetical protein
MRSDAGTVEALTCQPGSGSSWQSVTAALTGPLALFGLDVFAPLSLSWYEVVHAETVRKGPSSRRQRRCSHDSLPGYHPKFVGCCPENRCLLEDQLSAAPDCSTRLRVQMSVLSSGG